jgi:Cof subfamily protein (haloacid dehalogenase superfamily)
MDIKLVLSDIDGTILDDHQSVDSELKQTLLSLRQKHIPFILSSARSPEGMYPIAEDLGILDYPIACYNGAYVIKRLDQEDVSVISSHVLPESELRSIFQLISKSYSTVSINLYSRNKWYVSETDRWINAESKITNLDPIITDLNEFSSSAPVHKLLLIDEVDTISNLMDALQSLNLEQSSFILSKDNYLEVTNKKASKKEALRELANYYKIKIKDTMTLGDNFNDVPMFEASGLGVAMKNAPEQVKQIADVITESNNDNGVSKALKKYLD